MNEAFGPFQPATLKKMSWKQASLGHSFRF